MLKNKLGEEVLIVGIAGRARAGKGTLAAEFVRAGWKEESFAEPIKKALCSMFGFARALFDDPVTKEAELDWLGRSPRYLAQKLGTEFGRDMVAEDVWLRIMANKLRTDVLTHIVVSDVRFENEAAFIRHHGQLIHVERPVGGGLQGDAAQHVSEAGLKVDISRDIIVHNDASLEDYLNLCGDVFESLGNQKWRASGHYFSGFGPTINVPQDEPLYDPDWSDPYQKLRNDVIGFNDLLINGKHTEAYDSLFRARKQIIKLCDMAIRKDIVLQGRPVEFNTQG